MAGFGMDLVQIPNFAIDGPDPGLAAMEGFYGARENARRDQLAQISGNVDMRAQQQADQERIRFGQEQAALQQQQRAQAQMAARAREAESALAALADKISEGTARAGDFAALQTQFPEMSEGLKEPIAALEEDRRKSYTSLLYRSAIALKSNKPEVAAQLFKDRAEAARNSGDAIDADLSEATAEMIMESKDDPAEMLAMLGILGQSFDPKMNVAIFGEGEGNLSDRFKVVGSQLVDLNAEGGPQAVLTAPGQTETIYGPDGQPILTRGPSPADLKLTEAQGKATGFVYRMEESHKTLTELEDQGTSLWNKAAGGAPVVGNYMRSDDAQRFDQAKRDFINAVLRQESGAVISPEEFANADKQYFPQPGDSKAVIEQKRRNREVAIAGVRAAAGKGGETSPPSAGGSGSPGQTVIIDGYTIEEVP